MEQKEELQLLLGEAADRAHQFGDVGVDLLLDHGRRMALCRFQITAILGAGDLDEAFGGAAHRADLLSQRGTGALHRALVAKLAGHALTVSGDCPNASASVGLCNTSVVRVRVATLWPRVIPFRGLWVSPISDRGAQNPNRLCGV